MVGYFSALVFIKNGLVDNLKYLKDWEKGDPCTSNWIGVNCFNKAGANGYLHVKELRMMAMNLSGNLTPVSCYTYYCIVQIF
ncbi:probable LRR receptor-like serine/threonine-protein kinase At1g06840 [Solanum stenotomum]|uniref:probable LRR receptor-like serine/threonine-protein kinase At1g06840 n=1 Tax=Solanum stenotomum TaxID=172797 RepID=UPI0020D183F9|nr:probable LRR receptor-like serine/threonine-protein kinase At1g06840 [Solanum stenotomum]